MTPTTNDNTMTWKIVTGALSLLLVIVGSLTAIVYDNLSDQVTMNTRDIRTVRECQISNEKDLSYIQKDIAAIKDLLQEVHDKISP